MARGFKLWSYTALLSALFTNAARAQDEMLSRIESAVEVVVIDVDSLAQNAAASTLAEILQGRVAGVSVYSTGGLTEASSRIHIRGSASLYFTNQPLVFLDGVRLDNTSGSFAMLDALPLEAISRIEILKGASAGVFGSGATNGVVQIYTKAGATNQTRFAAKVEQGTVSSPEVFKPNAGFARNETQLANMRQVFGDPSIQLYQVVTRPFAQELFDTGHRQTYALTFSGGMPQLNYFLTSRYHRVAGPYHPQAEDFLGLPPGGSKDLLRRAQLHGNLTLFPTGKFRVRLSSSFGDFNQEFPSLGNNIYGPVALALFGKPERVIPTNAANTSNNPQGTAAFATVREATFTENRDQTQHFIASLTPQYHLTSEIKLRGLVGITRIDQRASSRTPFGWNVDGSSISTSNESLGERFRTQLTFAATGEWTRRFTAALASKFSVGAQRFNLDERLELLQASNAGIEVLIGPNALGEIYEATSHQTGFFAQEELALNERLFLNASVRLDQHSAYGATTRLRAFPLLAVAFLPAWKFGPLTHLRWHGALGKTTQPWFSSFTTYAPFTSSDGAGLAPNNLGDKTLPAEAATQWELGYDSRWFDDRLGFAASYWKRELQNAYYQTLAPASGGFFGTTLHYSGNVEAQGLELQARFNVMRKEHVNLSLFAHSAFLREKILALDGANRRGVLSSYLRYRNFIATDHAPGAFFGAKLNETAEYPIDLNRDLQPETREALLAFFAVPRDPSTFFPLVVDENRDGNLLDHYLGKPMPDWQGAFGFSFGLFKRLHLSSLFEYKAGNFTIHNLTDEFRRSHPVIDRNLEEVAVTESVLLNPASSAEERLAAASKWAKEFSGLTPYDGLTAFEKGDFIRWRELSVRYDLPFAVLGWSRASLTFAARNLALFSGYSGVDPETAAFGFDYNFPVSTEAFNLPLPRQFLVSLQTEF